MKIFFIIFFFYTSFAFGQKLPADYDEYLNNYRKPREYLVHSIDSTEFYYVLKTTVGKDSTILVIYKESDQLKGGNLKVNQVYTFYTYRHNDVSSAKY